MSARTPCINAVASSRPAAPRRLSPALLLLCLAGVAAPALAQQPYNSLVALGAISVPDFEGSADKTVRPLLLGRIDLGRHGSLRLAGLGLQYNLLGAQNPWSFGPVVSLRPARDDDVDDPVVGRLREVDGTVEAGLFVGYGWSDRLAQGDRLSLEVEAKGGRGSQLTFGASYQAPRQGALQLGVDLRATLADDRYMERYFSVDADNSARSGLPRYVADSGLKSVGLGVTGSYDLASQWTLLGRVGVSRLLGDARDSPIVRLRGDATAVSVGVALGYRF